MRTLTVLCRAVALLGAVATPLLVVAWCIAILCGTADDAVAAAVATFAAAAASLVAQVVGAAIEGRE